MAEYLLKNDKHTGYRTKVLIKDGDSYSNTLELMPLTFKQMNGMFSSLGFQKYTLLGLGREEYSEDSYVRIVIAKK